jgi:crotonobetainyl-CoA:carnitine CoA-transferase CaiB-like acyl-CoA transferase
MGQHMAQQAALGEPAKPMSIRTSAWSIYDIFESKDEQQVFVAVVSDTQWRQFCQHFDLDEFAADETLAANSSRVSQRDRIIPAVQQVFSTLDKAELMEKLEACGLPYAGVGRPADLFDDPHLLASGGLLDVTIPGGNATKLPALPLQMNGQRFGVKRDVPLQGQDIIEVLREAGYNSGEIDGLIARNIVAAGETKPDEDD